RILSAAAKGSTIFFADLTVRHPSNDNAELLWHCGNFPMELAKDIKNAKGGRHFVLPSKCAGTGEWELKQGNITIARFDGDHGEYKLFMGEGKSTDGPSTRGTYVWFEVGNWDQWEHKLVTGPYVHHCAGVYDNVAAVLHEACKYIPGLTADPAQPTECEIQETWLKG
ncbi:MAG: fucose isomerase, partial [Eubacteriales bacterium]